LSKSVVGYCTDNGFGRQIDETLPIDAEVAMALRSTMAMVG
jgi:hypothetical protein